MRLFVSYSHENKLWFGRLSPLLQFPLAKVVHIWHDQKLEAGNPWDHIIKRELDQMDVFICLVSFEFLASAYIKKVELSRALQRNRVSEVEVIPILLFPMDLQKEHPKLSKFNPLPAFGECWSDYEANSGHYQRAHQPIRKGLWEAIDRVQKRRAVPT